MTRLLSLFVAGIPETKGSMVHLGRGKMKSDNPREKAWSDLVSLMCKLEMRGKLPTTDPVVVDLEFYLPEPVGKRNRRDIDKLIRSCLDAMNNLVYVDDEQVVQVNARKSVVICARPWRLGDDVGRSHGARIVVESYPVLL